MADDIPSVPNGAGYDVDKRNWRNSKINVDHYWFRFQCGRFFRLELNPVVTMLAIVAIVAFILWCILEPDRKLTELTMSRRGLEDLPSPFNFK